MRVTDRDLRLVCLWLSGAKWETITGEFGLSSHGSLSRRAKQLGLPPRLSRVACGRVNLFPYIVSWAKRGLTAEEIALGIGSEMPSTLARVGVRPSVIPREATTAEERLRKRIAKRVKIMRGKSNRRVRAARVALERVA